MVRTNSGIRLGRWFGITVSLHPSWFLGLLLIMMSLGPQVFGRFIPQAGGGVHVMALLTSVLFYGCLLAHEFGHALVAKFLYGMRIEGITLFLFGGVAGLRDEPPKASAEFWIAIAGPLVSLGLGAGFLLLCRWVAPGIGDAMAAGLPLMQHSPGDLILYVLGVTNIVLVVFNMLPGYPLDGGRVLRSIVWGLSGSILTGTRTAAFMGRVIAYGMIGYGIGSFVDGSTGGGLWMVFLGFFLAVAARQGRLGVELREGLRGLTARDMMTSEPRTLAGSLSLEAAANEFYSAEQQAMPVLDFDGRYAGMVAVADLQRVPRHEWSRTTVQGLLNGQPSMVRRMGRSNYVAPEATALDVYGHLATQPFGKLPVLAEGHRLVGTITARRLVATLRERGVL